MSHVRTCGNCGHGAERQGDGACVTCVDVNSNWTPKITQQAARDLLAALKKVKLRICYIGMPNEPPDWHDECVAIEQAIANAKGADDE